MFDWSGRTVVCIASGPSLTADDCELVRQSGHPTIVTNTTFRLCPWADVLIAFDGKWWKHYADEVKSFAGRKISPSWIAPNYGAEGVYKEGLPMFSVYPNSGACAVSLAMVGNPDKIVLLGYDASFDGNKTHWHENHPKGLANASTVASWARMFRLLAKHATVEIVNASRRTALTCFARIELEQAL